MDVYKVDILCSGARLRVCAKCGFKLVNLNADYNFALAEMGVNLIALVNELKSPIFFSLMSLGVS